MTLLSNLIEISLAAELQVILSGSLLLFTKSTLRSKNSNWSWNSQPKF